MQYFERDFVVIVMKGKLDELYSHNSYIDMYTKAPFTLRSIFGTARIKLVPVPLFWF
jgi:hypothetical protein